MHADIGDNAVQLRVALRAWDLRTDQVIDVIHYAGLVLFSKDRMEVRVWQTLQVFLELNDAIVSHDPAQDAVVHQEVQNLLGLWMKTLAMMSGRSAAVCPGSKLLRISGQLALQVIVMNISGLPKKDVLKGLPAGISWFSLWSAVNPFGSTTSSIVSLGLIQNDNYVTWQRGYSLYWHAWQLFCQHSPSF